MRAVHVPGLVVSFGSRWWCHLLISTSNASGERKVKRVSVSLQGSQNIELGSSTWPNVRTIDAEWAPDSARVDPESER